MDNNLNILDSPNNQAVAVPRTFMAGVFSWMTTALGISALVAYLFGTDASLFSYITGPLGYIIMFAPFILVLVMSAAVARLPYSALVAMFLVYSVLMGMSLSVIFMVYPIGNIASVFAITAGMFAFMAFLGYTTKTDLTKFGSILLMALVGVVIAIIVNIFMGSSGLNYAISCICVIIFTGLTAYDVQKLKDFGVQVQNGTEVAAKMSIMGALNLYLDFINLFLALLRIFGRRD